MEEKIFKDKKIKIRKVSKNDLNNVKKFQDHINSLILEEAKILMKNKVSLKGEKEYLERKIKSIKKHKEVFLIAEHNNNIVGTADVILGRERNDHIAEFGIVIKQGYRGIGLGKYLMKEVLKEAEKELKPKPKIFKLLVYPNNKPGINLYKKMGFKMVAKIPKQIQYKKRLIDELVMIKMIKK